jgi:hypothetical protein
MHGTAALPIIGAAVFSLAVLIALTGREHDFGEAVTRVLESVAGVDGAARFYPVER